VCCNYASSKRLSSKDGSFFVGLGFQVFVRSFSLLRVDRQVNLMLST
jgi:hypothetical protein